MTKAKKKRAPYTPPFTAAHKKAIAAGYRKGETLTSLSKQHKCSTCKIRKILMDQKVTMRRPGPKPKAKAKNKPAA